MAEFGCLYSEVLLTRNAWEKRKLGEVATITMGQSPDSKNYTLNPQDHILVQGNADIKNGWVEPRVWTTQITKIAKKGSVLLSVRAPVGEVSKTAFDVVLGRGVASVGQTDFLYQYLITLKINGFWLRYSTGSTFDSINSADIKDAIIFLPKKNEQDRIAKTLNCIDSLIAATQHKIDALEQTKKALLQRLFDQSWRFKGYSDPWEKRKLGELAEFINGRAYKQDELLASGKYPVLRVGNFYTNDNWYYSDLELPEKYYAEKGDLLYTWSATFGPHIWIGPKVIYHYHIWKVALKNLFEKDFALQFFEADRVRLLNSTNGSTMIHVTKKDMESKGILLPDISEQRNIGEFLRKADDLIAATQSRLSSLELLKKALLQALFI
ncbi:EcoKI restriction-modification system protein HsdS [Lacticaseibacillus paracasei]|uniref:restriction endonuclease subunit S n=1 Tax=Lacticaseibacillus paracasei TaxID=1597 RepID=UPI000297D7A7|nr:restriction endonuclease subunit S [Lacticaseibacillus paracasei]EKQ20390.1 type I restriction-modification system, specificity subunit S [Lacticaseibacillus casei UW4]RND74672.1 EcoKI restriction-modification system protein HsdS [Lacticaseibacillus paracasei]